jgi:hypothetical protein
MWSPLEVEALIIGFFSFVVLLVQTMISINKNLRNRLSQTKAIKSDKAEVQG